MKKIMMVFACFVLASIVVFPQKLEAACSCNAGVAKIYADPSYSQTVRNFVPGDTIYIRLETEGGGEDMKLVRVINQQNEEVRKAIFTREGSGPYTYTASMLVPTEPGTYYLDIQIKGPDRAFASQENFNVGTPSGSTNNIVVSAHSQAITGGSGEALVKANSVIGGNSVQNDAGTNRQLFPTETPLGTPSLQALASPPSKLSFWQSARLMVNQILSKLLAIF